MIHYIAHILGWNEGSVISKLDDDGNVWIAFQCCGCGKVSGKHKPKDRDTNPKKRSE